MLIRAEKMLDERCSNVTACTYHSFCVKMLRAYGRAIGLSPDFTIISPGDVCDAIKFIKAKSQTYKQKGMPTASTLADIISSG